MSLMLKCRTNQCAASLLGLPKLELVVGPCSQEFGDILWPMHSTQKGAEKNISSEEIWENTQTLYFYPALYIDSSSPRSTQCSAEIALPTHVHKIQRKAPHNPQNEYCSMTCLYMRHPGEERVHKVVGNALESHIDYSQSVLWPVSGL